MHLHKLLSLRFALATAAMSLMLSTNSFALNVTVVQGQSCPANTTLLGYQEAEANKAELCTKLGQWDIARIGGGGAMDGSGYRCGMRPQDTRALNAVVCVVPLAAPAPDYVQRFAPELRHDRASNGYPMSAQVFYEAMKNYRAGAFRVENTDRATLAGGAIPTYYQARMIGRQTRINYWWFSGYQHACFAGQGSHNGDWEHVTVILTEDRSAVAAVSYYQHGDHYTRIAGPRAAPCTPDGVGRCSGPRGFPMNGTHPVVYSGKYAHGSYHDSNSFGPPGPTECAQFGDYRNPASSADYLQSWRNLVDLDGNQEPWINDDRTASWAWGPDGISTHPTQRSPVDAEHAASCTGSAMFGVANAGCYQSECLAGDDQAFDTCLKECKSGYTNMGLTCNKGRWPWEWSVYARNKYNFNYKIPAQDAGLIRRRNTGSEWDLP
ncbi:hypothetical protein RBA41_09125 [Massilia sp. CCM 9210]|uniref:hypothetical protein n=1 Tax=Massilia scottii TaxID=3057166 RepID=UPI0027968518|nr:hypothetical protein [Massilia sp. CCM 9210]MDQ1813463.1 hypothetical protein [Massilia sp. CCM 9210]